MRHTVQSNFFENFFENCRDNPGIKAPSATELFYFSFILTFALK